VHLDRVRRGDEAADVPTALEAYIRVVRDMRAVALDARRRIEQGAAVTADAREYARRRRRRAQKVTKGAGQ
jgi:hypothetical protein